MDQPSSVAAAEKRADGRGQNGLRKQAADERCFVWLGGEKPKTEPPAGWLDAAGIHVNFVRLKRNRARNSQATWPIGCRSMAINEGVNGGG